MSEPGVLHSCHEVLESPGFVALGCILICKDLWLHITHIYMGCDRLCFLLIRKNSVHLPSELHFPIQALPSPFTRIENKKIKTEKEF